MDDDLVNMHILAPLLILSAIVAVLGAITYLAHRDQKTVDSAQRLIANPGHHVPRNGEVVFRKARLPAYLLLLLFFWVFCIAVDAVMYNWGSALTAARPLTGFSAALGIFISPLGMAARELRYAIHVVDDELIISDLITRRVRLRDISDVKIGVSRASSFCQIGLMSGEDGLKVGSDLQHFPEFVRLLCERVDELKTRGGTGRATES